MNQLDKDIQVSEAKAIRELSRGELATVWGTGCYVLGASGAPTDCGEGLVYDEIAAGVRRGLRAAMDYFAANRKWEIGPKY